MGRGELCCPTDILFGLKYIPMLRLSSVLYQRFRRADSRIIFVRVPMAIAALGGPMCSVRDSFVLAALKPLTKGIIQIVNFVHHVRTFQFI